MEAEQIEGRMKIGWKWSFMKLKATDITLIRCFVTGRKTLKCCSLLLCLSKLNGRGKDTISFKNAVKWHISPHGWLQQSSLIPLIPNMQRNTKGCTRYFTISN